MSCISGGQRAANAGEQFGLSFGNFIFGGLPGTLMSTFGGKTPLDKLQDKLGDLNDQTQQFMQNGNLALFKAQITINNDLFDVIKLGNSDIIETLKYIREGLSQKITTNQVYIAFCYISIIILYIYLMLN